MFYFIICLIYRPFSLSRFWFLPLKKKLFSRILKLFEELCVLKLSWIASRFSPSLMNLHQSLLPFGFWFLLLNSFWINHQYSYRIKWECSFTFDCLLFWLPHRKNFVEWICRAKHFKKSLFKIYHWIEKKELKNKKKTFIWIQIIFFF